MSFYADSAHRPGAAIEVLHAGELQSFAQCGTWGSAAQRTAVAAFARKVRVEADLQESAGDEALADIMALPAPVQRLVREVALGGIGVNREFCSRVQSEGVTEGAYVEIVALVSRIVNLDVFARGLGVAPRPLAEPADDAKPAFTRPAEAVDEGFFTASIPNLPEGGATAKSLYGQVPRGNVWRAVTLVPEEGRRVIDLVEAQYFPGEKLMDFAADNGHALSRAQLEAVATKVSEHNQCFY
jgi:hypothetical protein